MVKLRLTFPLLLCVLAAGCGIKTWRFEPSPGNFIDRELPWRVGVITDKAFNPYQIRFGYWSAPTFTWSMEGLPDAFTYTLKQQFRSAETLPAGRGITPERHDLAGKMSVDHLHFEGAKTSTGRDRVDLTMTFWLEQARGSEVFRTTLSTSVYGYSLSRNGSEHSIYMRPRPQNVFPKAFRDVFEQRHSAISRAVAPSLSHSTRRRGPSHR